MARNLAALLALAAAAAADPVGPTFPWGIHVAYGAEGGATSMTVMWSTRARTPTLLAIAAPAPANVSGEAIAFSDGGNVQTLHRVRLTGLAPATVYTYAVGDGAGAMSKSFTFMTQPADAAAWQPTLAIFGDMGISSNAQATMPLLLADAAAGRIDAVLHVCVREILRIFWGVTCPSNAYTPPSPHPAAATLPTTCRAMAAPRATASCA